MNRIFTCLLLILLFGFGCKDKNTESCMDVNYGQLDVDPENKFPIPYDDNQTLVFLDSLGVELKFTSTQRISFYLSAIDTITEGSCAGEAVVYGKRQSKFLSFHSDSLGYVMSLQHSVWMELDESQPLFYDIFLASYRKDTIPQFAFSVSISFITDDRGNDLSNNFFEQYTFIEEITLFSKTFYDVYYGTRFGTGAIYFNQEFGIIGFREKSGKLWVLDRIE